MPFCCFGSSPWPHSAGSFAMDWAPARLIAKDWKQSFDFFLRFTGVRSLPRLRLRGYARAVALLNRSRFRKWTSLLLLFWETRSVAAWRSHPFKLFFTWIPSERHLGLNGATLHSKLHSQKLESLVNLAGGSGVQLIKGFRICWRGCQFTEWLL